MGNRRRVGAVFEAADDGRAGRWEIRRFPGTPSEHRHLNRWLTETSVVASGQEDNRLVERCQAGDLEAFNQLVLKYQDRVFDTVYRMVGHREDALDLSQETFVKAYQGITSFRGQSSFYTWLFRIAVNGALSRRRSTARSRRHVAVRYESPEDLGASAAVDERLDGPDRAAEREEDRQAVIHALRRLDAEQRAVIVLKDLEAADYSQIAAILECPRGTVKSRLHRARMALRAELERQMRGG